MKKLFALLLSISFVFLTNCSMDNPGFKDVDTSRITVEASQGTVNYSNVDFSFSGLDNIEKIVVSASSKYDGMETRSVIKAYYPSRSSSIYSLSMDFENFGKFDVSVDFFSQGRHVETINLDPIGVVAEEYNIAILNATFPVLYFSTSIWDINMNNGKPVPTIMYLERSSAYDWDQLPEHVYALPYATDGEIRRELFHDLRPRMRKYIAELAELNPDSKFNLYVTDNYGEIAVEMLYANAIPENQFTISLLSDGVGSYNMFNRTFNTADVTAKYSEMASAWRAIKERSAEASSYSNDLFQNLPYLSGQNYSILVNYPYVMANEEENITWWIPRVDGTLVSPDSTFLNTVKASDGIVQKNMNTLLQGIISNGHSDEFKNLYSFNNEMFAEAVTAQKNVMLILGTKTQYEYHFDDYVKFLKSYYGDSYTYYYKGHPGTPTGLDSEKQERLESLELIDVESSIPAELILFFYPDIHFSGYPTTTFQSAQNAEKAHALFNVTKASAGAYSYVQLMDLFVSYNNDGTYLVEYNATTDSDVWDPVNESFIE